MGMRAVLPSTAVVPTAVTVTGVFWWRNCRWVLVSWRRRGWRVVVFFFTGRCVDGGVVPVLVHFVFVMVFVLGQVWARSLVWVRHGLVGWRAAAVVGSGILSIIIIVVVVVGRAERMLLVRGGESRQDVKERVIARRSRVQIP